MKKHGIITIAFFLFLLSQLAGAEPINLSNLQKQKELSPKSVQYKYQATEKADTARFRELPLPSFPPKKGLHFLRFELEGNKTLHEPVWIKIPFLNCEALAVEFCDINGNVIKTLQHEAQSSMAYRIDSIPATASYIQFKINTSFAVFVPVKFMVNDLYFQANTTENFFYSLYFGIIVIMAIYNLFVFVSTKSGSYLYYSIYTLSFGLAQFCLAGFFNTLISKDFILNKELTIFFSGISGIFGAIFFNSFLETKTKAPRIRLILLVLAALYAITIVIGFAKVFDIANNLLNLLGMGVALAFLTGSAYLSSKKNRPARFYLVAWLTFCTALALFVLTNVGVMPYNGFTQFLLPLGSAIEISLLSFALADKINILSMENETLIREQNVVLERQVKERTSELIKTNEDLKETQAQLVNSEKMASLGHLTAGIAHEINNPINFISANISPLRRDIEDYETVMGLINELDENNVQEKLPAIRKTAADLDVPYLKNEIQALLNGIDEGARRTAEIVKNLKIFSHIDKAEHSYYSVNEGITSTLHILSHKLGRIEVEQNLEDLPAILCYPGKLNQVFMNLLSNAIDACNDAEKPMIKVSSARENDLIVVKIADNGHGIPESIIKDIFNPFFTTKDVGSGTGLGLSISISIIHEHGGDIKVQSTPGAWTEFTITLPVKL